MWQQLVVVALAASALAPTCGTTRFVRLEDGRVEAQPPPSLASECASCLKTGWTAEELGDHAFFNLPGAQPKAPPPLHGRAAGSYGSYTDKAAKATRLLAKLSPSGSEALALNVALEAYLYDDVFMADGSHLVERELKENQRFHSESGLDDPHWEELRTRWDSLRGVTLRNTHGNSAESEVASIFREQGGVLTVRHNMEQKILRTGRGDKRTWTVWNQLGNTFRATGDVQRAIQCFRRALWLRPDGHDILVNLSIVISLLGYLDDAEKLMKHAIELQPEGVLPNFVYGNLLVEQGRVVEALQFYRKTISIQPNFLPGRRKLREHGPHQMPHFGKNDCEGEDCNAELKDSPKAKASSTLADTKEQTVEQAFGVDWIVSWFAPSMIIKNIYGAWALNTPQTIFGGLLASLMFYMAGNSMQLFGVKQLQGAHRSSQATTSNKGGNRRKTRKGSHASSRVS